MRITGQLIVAKSGTHIWAERFERRLADIFDLQDEISENIVGAVEPEILSAEMRRARGKRPDDSPPMSVCAPISASDSHS